MSLDSNVLMIGGAALLFVLILVAAAFIGAMATIKGWIRDVAGVKEKSITEISGQPIEIAMAKEFVTITRFDSEIQDVMKAMSDDRKQNTREHENLFSKLGGQERGINGILRELEKKVAALDERTVTTNSTIEIQGQKIDRIVERLKA